MYILREHMLLVIVIVICVISLVIAVSAMALPAANYGLARQCPSCPDRKDTEGVWHWSSVARHYPDFNAASMQSLLKWLKRMSQQTGTCNDCSRVLNMVAIELATIVIDHRQA